jgi:DNA-binding MarR family transcriptional regulator
MKSTSTPLKFFMILAKVQSIMERRFDGKLGGISFGWFMILHQLDQPQDGKLRRIDLAEKVGLTASGVTRILLPMEKIGLVKRETNENDGRVSFVSLTSAGRKKYKEALERAEIFMEDIIPKAKENKIEEMNKELKSITGDI